MLFARPSGQWHGTLAPTIPKRTLCSEGGRLHSNDIAFKPAMMVGTRRIQRLGQDLGNNKDAAATTTSSDVTDAAAVALLEQRMEALEAARAEHCLKSFLHRLRRHSRHEEHAAVMVRVRACVDLGIVHMRRTRNVRRKTADEIVSRLFARPLALLWRHSRNGGDPG